MTKSAEKLKPSKNGIVVSNCNVTCVMSDLHASAVLALANAAMANAHAITAIANKTSVQIDSGFKFVSGESFFGEVK